MHNTNLQKELCDLERRLPEAGADFSAVYMAVSDLHRIVSSNPSSATVETVDALGRVMECRRHQTQKQAYFLFKEAADALAAIAGGTHLSQPAPGRALAALKNMAIGLKGSPHRAATEALGSLPLGIEGPTLETPPEQRIPSISWSELLGKSGLSPSNHMRVYGRSLALPCHEKNRCFVVKLLRRDDSTDSSLREVLWMKYLERRCACLPVRFDIPVPCHVDGSSIFALEDGPHRRTGIEELHPRACAIAFWAHRDYYHYINEHVQQPSLSPAQFTEALHRNAWLLGRLASWGIIHSAPIPLFHNRVQRDRRSDGGIYQWHRRGRLDRWLHSCRFPNMGLSGLRDLEHLSSFKGPARRLYHHVGTHILSLLLVTASYYRNRDMNRVGRDPSGNPHDARDLFELEHLRECISSLVRGYHLGFSGGPLQEDLFRQTDELSRKMVEEMGQDKHMEEVLRTVDQREMTHEAFRRFLLERGFSEEHAAGIEKGGSDLTVLTGPHLGGFNQQISIPELTDYVATAAALCMADRFHLSAPSGPGTT